MEERIGRWGQSESQIKEKRNGRLVGASGSLQNGTGFSRKTFEHTGPAEMERVALVPQRERAVGMYVRAAFARRKRNRAVCPEYQIVWWKKDSQAEREPHLGERGGSEREHGEETMDFTVKESRFQGGKRG